MLLCKELDCLWTAVCINALCFLHKNNLHMPEQTFQQGFDIALAAFLEADFIFMTLLNMSFFIFRIYCIWHDFSKLQHPALADHSLPWQWITIWLSSEKHYWSWKLFTTRSVNHLWVGAPSRGNIWYSRKTRHCTQRSEE